MQPAAATSLGDSERCLAQTPSATRSQERKKERKLVSYGLDCFTHTILTHEALDIAIFKSFNDLVANFNNEIQFTPGFSGYYQHSVKTER